MKKVLMTLLQQIEQLQEIAEGKADDSEREATQDRYTNIASFLEDAAASVKEAIDEYDS